MTFTRWNAPSDYDYWDEVEGHHEPNWYSVTCLTCERPFYVRADDDPPYHCNRCIQRKAEADQRAADRQSGAA